MIQLCFERFDAFEPLNVSQAGVKVNLQRLAVQRAMPVDEMNLNLVGLFAERGIGPDVDCRRKCAAIGQ